MSHEVPSPAGAQPLLSFDCVSKRHPDGRREIVVLSEASFEISAGDFIGVWGARRTGKSTLLRLACGIELPDAGAIRFDGRDTARMSVCERARLLRDGIGLVATDDWRPNHRERVVDLVALPLVSSGATLHEARRRARALLGRTGAGACADDLARSLSLGERTRVMLARALINEPRLLLVDEPAVIPSLSERDEFYGLLRLIARERGVTLMVASEELAPLRGASVRMSIGHGELMCSQETQGTVLAFPDRGRVRTESPGRR
ncbi:MAG TPA: ATP-binding cassette domain-containing protein [Solirubrobacteraceae bacterium]|jgi:putative ABC transport system ATP-binding protein